MTSYNPVGCKKMYGGKRSSPVEWNVIFP